ncbi:MAG: LemA family protein [Candidatus Delongbacteria bacterium]|nr:LemA family protein [Candidatus Delongbacteria bacterium]
MKKLVLVLAVVVVLVLVVGGCFIGDYNKAAVMEEKVKKSWGNVENALQRRYDLIPNLVETVKGYATHEKEIFEALAEARKGYFSAQTPNEKMAASQGMESALSRLLLLTENYPNLKANESFLKLQDELAGTENRISVERNRYNESVEEFRGYARSLVGSIFVKIRGIDYTQYDYFKAQEAAQTAPKVQF